MKIKALSLWQPWASLISVGAKRYETRSWSTNYRGPLLICAALRPPDGAIVMELNIKTGLRQRFPGGISMPRGMALAIVDLIDVYDTDYFTPPDPSQLYFGDFSPGRYAWQLINVRAIEPFPVKGRQGLFNVDVPDELLREVRP